MSDMNLPEPQGYRILIAIPKRDEKFANSSIVLPEDSRRKEEIATIVGLVVKMGPEAYADQDKFPNGPWCKEGDFVLMRAYSGTRFKIKDQEFRIINDDTVEAVVADPREITRI